LWMLDWLYCKVDIQKWIDCNSNNNYSDVIIKLIILDII
jgi:hypothetical protein